MRTLEELLSVYNHATNPAALRTDHQHARQNKRARIAMAMIHAAGFREGHDWQESDNGRRWVKDYRNAYRYIRTTKRAQA